MNLGQYAPPPVDHGATTGADNAVHIPAMLISEWARDRLSTIAASTPRARQATIGASEIGQVCERRLAYRIAGTPIVNLPDPLKAMIGTGFHTVAAAGLQLEAPGRCLVEHRTEYRGVAGTVDLFDRFTHRLIDWKTTGKRRITQYRHDGPPVNYLVQANLYAAGLITEGEDVQTIALVFVPRDGELHDVWTWTTTPNRALADEYVDRYQRIAEQTDRQGPASVSATPTNLCGWCPNYRPNATNLHVACPGRNDA